MMYRKVIKAKTLQEALDMVCNDSIHCCGCGCPLETNDHTCTRSEFGRIGMQEKAEALLLAAGWEKVEE